MVSSQSVNDASGSWIPFFWELKAGELISLPLPCLARGGTSLLVAQMRPSQQDLACRTVSQGRQPPPTYGPHLHIWLEALLPPLLPVSLSVKGQLVGAWLHLAWCQKPRAAAIWVCVAVEKMGCRERTRSHPTPALLDLYP
jgi:hypothetical protein